MADERDDWLVTLGVTPESFDNRPDDEGDNSGTGGDKGIDLSDERGSDQSGDGSRDTQQDQRDEDTPGELPTGPAVSAQSGDVEDALKAKDLWSDTGSRYGKLLNDAKVPDGVSVSTKIIVDKALNVRITVTTNPSDPSGAALARLLNQKCAGPFKGAITEYFNRKGLTVTDTLEVTWLNW
jgi:hypothetical protein